MASSRRAAPMSPNSLARTPLHFFKVIIPGILEDKKLRIPETFARKFGDELSDIVTLTVPNGRIWHVQLSKDEKKIWFRDGWHDFVQYHSICVGHFLVFKYRKNSKFHVLIFDKTACEIEYPYFCGGPEIDEKSSLQEDEMDSDDSVEITGFTTPNSPSKSLKNKAFNECRRSSSNIYAPQSEHRRDKPSLGSVPGTNKSLKDGASFKTPKLKHPNNTDTSTQDELEEEIKIYGSSPSRKRTMRAVERERALNAAKAFEPVNPFCRVVLRRSYLTRKPSIMYFPSYFAKSHLRGVSGFIELQNSDGNQWPVRCVYREGTTKLTQGWHQFTLDNSLREGDVCVFEVLRLSDIVLKVTTFHVLESAECANRLSSNSALGGNKFQKGFASDENPKIRHGIDICSKRCKIEELDKINECNAVSNESELIKARHKARALSLDKENRLTETYNLELLTSLKDQEIYVGKNFRYISKEDRERASAAVGLLKPKRPSFMLILQPYNLQSRVVYVPSKFGNKYLNKNSKYIKLEDSNGREWPQRISFHNGFCIERLTRFYEENNLGEGDTCIFELIKVTEPLLKVSVFYASTK